MQGTVLGIRHQGLIRLDGRANVSGRLGGDVGNGDVVREGAVAGGQVLEGGRLSKGSVVEAVIRTDTGRGGESIGLGTKGTGSAFWAAWAASRAATPLTRASSCLIARLVARSSNWALPWGVRCVEY